MKNESNWSKVNGKMLKSLKTIHNLLDLLITIYMLLIPVVLITGGFSLETPLFRISAHRIGSVLQILLPCVAAKWVLTRVLKTPFQINSRIVVIIKRAFELAILTQVILIPVVWVHGEFDLPLLKAHILSASLNAVGILFVLRLAVGRHINGLLTVASTAVALLVFLYTTEAFLRISDQRKLNAHQQEIVRQNDGPQGEIVTPQNSGVLNATQKPAILPEKPVDPAPTSGLSRSENGQGHDQSRESRAKPTDSKNTVKQPEKIGKAKPAKLDLGRNGGHNWTWGHRVAYNSFGFREREIAVPKPKGTVRIMVLGDSLTWGAGLAPEERYTNLLEKNLKEALNYSRIEVLNFGLAGGPTVTERDILKKWQHQVDPDLIVVGFCFNDPQPRGQNYSVERARLHDLYDMIAQLRHIGLKKTYAFMIERFDSLFISLKTIPAWTEALDRVYAKDSRQWRSFEKALVDIKQISDARGLAPPVFVLLIQGLAKDRPYDIYITKWFHQAGEAAENAGFLLVNPESAFIRELTLKELPVNPKDGHPSAKCNRIYAKELLDIVLPIVEKIIVSRST